MKKITKKEALIQCEKMWRWLSEHPTSIKQDYFDSINLSKEDIPNQECYACQYKSDHFPVKNTTFYC